jgi:peptide/nickel transport system substrate-binding protein
MSLLPSPEAAGPNGNRRNRRATRLPRALERHPEALNITVTNNQQALAHRRSARIALTLTLALAAALGCGGRDRGRGARHRADAAAPAHADAGVRLVAAPARALPELPEPPPPGPTGGTLRVHLEAEPPHLNPLLEGHQVIQRVVSGLVYETLVECRASGYAPALAQSWEESADGLRLALRLRPGARWHDGRPVTATDVQATIEPLLRAGTRQSTLHALLADVEAVEGIPEHGVRLRLARPSRLPLRALCEIPILPAEQLRGGSNALAQLGRLPMGTGPFRFAAWEHNRRIRLVRQATVHPPYLDEIVFEIDTDGARALARTRRGEIDVLPRLLESHYPDQVAAGALRETLQLYRLTPDRYSFLVVNQLHGVLADSRVRRALALLWNRPRMAEEVHRGLARPIGAPPFGAVPPTPFDLPGAQRLLDAAGLRDSNSDGVRDRAGAPVRLTFLLPAGARSIATEARAYAQDLRRAGLLVELTPVDPNALLGRLKQGAFDLAPLVWEGRRDDDPAALFGPQGELAFTGYRSPALQGLLDELRKADGPAGRAPVLQRIAELLAAEQPVIFLYRHDVAALAARRVHGLAGEGDRLDFRGVWLEP